MSTEATPGLDLSTLEFWGLPMEDRNATFARLRADGGMHFFDEPELKLFARGPGYWAITSHALVTEVSCHPELFCSGKGTQIGDTPEPLLEFFGSMLNLDDPRHARFRRIVGKAFTPKMLESFRGAVERAAGDIVGAVAERGECDFVTDIAALVPLRVINAMMGVPASEEQHIFDCSNRILGALDPEYVPDQSPEGVGAAVMGAAQELAGLGFALAEERIRSPREDLITALVTAEVDGEKLTAQELGSFFILLALAGNETTRNSLAWGLYDLDRHPEQRAAWQADPAGLAGTAVEEIVRCSSPVIHFRRTVTRDGVRLGDHVLNEGDKVALFYPSANRDEAVFDGPDRFDLSRSPNPHVGFGGPGPHFCLGFHLARREISVTMQEVLQRLPDIHVTGEPDRLYSNFIAGVKHLPVAWSPNQ